VDSESRQPSWIHRTIRLAALPLEALVSRRGLPVVFLLLAALLVLSGWLRPPLSPDLRALHLSLGLVPSAAVDPDALLHGARPVPVDSAGVLLLAILGIGVLFVVVRPRNLSMVAGLLLAGGIVANAAVAINAPALIERLDWEFEQRQQMVQVLNATPGKQPLTTTRNGRTSVLLGAPSADEQRGDLKRGWVYLLYGRWLILWAAFGLLLSTSGSLMRRMRWLAGWSLAGVGLALIVCWPRLQAEYYWRQAQRAEGRCNLAAAREALAKAVEYCPAFASMERTWLLTGKLDYLEGGSTAQATVFRAYQLTRERSGPRSVAYREDLPWLIARTADYRKGLATPPVGFDLVGNPPTESTDAGVLDYSEGMEGARGRFQRVHHYARKTEPHEARSLMEGLMHSPARIEPAVRRQTARLWIDLGLDDYLRAPTLTDGGLDYSRRQRAFAAARDAWLRATQHFPSRPDGVLYLGLLDAEMHPDWPEAVTAAWEPLLPELADRSLQADMLATLGEIYLRAGDPATARRFFAESFDRLNLPRKKNYRAQRGLGGL
jgi:hypothetical protein